MNVKDKIKNLPESPGVYLMYDDNGKVIYVGKAKNIKNRVGTYFKTTYDSMVKLKALAAKIYDVDYIITSSEKEALILESNLIKKHKPKYNVTFKDDKAQPYLRLNQKHKYPDLSIVRKVKNDGALYFGPFYSSQAVRSTLKTISKIFPLRKCKENSFRHRQRPCLNFQIGNCLGPCCNKVKEEEYQNIVKDVKLFLEGKDKELLKRLKDKMEEEANMLNFEMAGKIRDRISDISITLEKQKVVSTKFFNQDVVGLYRKDSFLGIMIFFIRAGRIIGSKRFSWHKAIWGDMEVISSFLKQFYSGGEFIPQEIILPVFLEDSDVIQQWLSEKKGRKLIITFPRRGRKKKLLEMAQNNLIVNFNDFDREEDEEDTLGDLKSRLRLLRTPYKIACCDISNLFGECAVGGVVYFERGRPQKSLYRKFKIKIKKGIDDYGMMYEVLIRQFKQYIRSNNFPDLMIIDGGKGQLNVAIKVLKELGVNKTSVVGLAKGGNKSFKTKWDEKIFLPHIKNPLILPKDSLSLLMLQKIRDEAHRFAINYYRKLKLNKSKESILDGIPRIGPVKKKTLLAYFGSIQNIKNASLEELQKVPGISPQIARDILDILKYNKN
ncbi:MAG: excinuclease ABC subunit UvrC [Thermodesulfobacteriota bacterium]|nr:excinuclease ABC subunit UvrC [Thermodesulfobacteriota bacterium]